MGRPKIWYEFKCAECGIKFQLTGEKKRRNNKLTFCSMSCSGKYKSKQYKGKHFSEPPHPIGKKHPRWKGGGITSQGYRSYSIANVKILEHRAIMEKHLGRKLKHCEQIHHINGNKLDNRLDNLLLFPNAREHTLYHQSLLKAA